MHSQDGSGLMSDLKVVFSRKVLLSDLPLLANWKELRKFPERIGAPHEEENREMPASGKSQSYVTYHSMGRVLLASLSLLLVLAYVIPSPFCLAIFSAHSYHSPGIVVHYLRNENKWFIPTVNYEGEFGILPSEHCLRYKLPRNLPFDLLVSM